LIQQALTKRRSVASGLAEKLRIAATLGGKSPQVTVFVKVGEV